MKHKLTPIAIVLIFLISACATKKNNVQNEVAPVKKEVPAASNTYNNFNNNFGYVKPAARIYKPTEATLSALQNTTGEVKMETLMEGFTIFTAGACINCHVANDINDYGELRWRKIIDDMAPKAYLTAVQKDAVLKYVIAIKQTTKKL